MCALPWQRSENIWILCCGGAEINGERFHCIEQVRLHAAAVWMNMNEPTYVQTRSLSEHNRIAWTILQTARWMCEPKMDYYCEHFQFTFLALICVLTYCTAIKSSHMKHYITREKRNATKVHSRWNTVHIECSSRTILPRGII